MKPIIKTKKAISDKRNFTTPFVFKRANVINAAANAIMPMPNSETHIFVIASIEIPFP
jgi:hypothetical protein